MSNELDKLKNAVADIHDEHANQAVSKIDDSNTIGYVDPITAVYPFFNFRYTYLEVSSSGGKARLTSRETRFENGKLVSEECDGELDHNAVQRMLVEAQTQFINQITTMMKPFLAFSPFRSIGRSDDK